MQAVILVGGGGTRLRPLTYSTPKSALSLVNRPFITYMLDWLAGHGVDDVIMACGFLPDQVRAVVGERHGAMTIRYLTEPEPRGTGGAVKFVQDLLDDRFFVLNGDVLTDIDLSAVLSVHEQNGAKATLSLYPVDDPSAYGLVRTDDQQRILDFLEKPKPEQIDTDQINAGAYMLQRDVIEAMAADRAVSFERETFPTLIGDGLFGVRADGYWLDIGTPDRFLEATRDILEGTVRTGVEPGADGAMLDDGAEAVAPSLIGIGTVVEAGARVGPCSSTGDGCWIERDAVVERSVLHAGVTVGRGAVVRDSIVGEGASLGAGALLEAQTLIGVRERVDAGTSLAGGRVGGE